MVVGRHIPYHVAREDAYGPHGFDPDAQVSFCTRGQDMALVVYDLEEEGGWKNARPAGAAFKSSMEELGWSSGDPLALVVTENKNQKPGEAKNLKPRSLIHPPGMG